MSACIRITSAKIEISGHWIQKPPPAVRSVLYYSQYDVLLYTHTFITFRVRRREMYIVHARLCICLCVRLSLESLPHYYMDRDVTWGNGRECPLVVHYWADLQSLHGFRCYENRARTRNVSECLYSLYAWLVLFFITDLIELHFQHI